MSDTCSASTLHLGTKQKEYAVVCELASYNNLMFTLLISAVLIAHVVRSQNLDFRFGCSLFLSAVRLIWLHSCDFITATGIDL